MKYLTFGLFLLSFLLFSCNESDDITPDVLTGTYIGTIDNLNLSKSSDTMDQDKFTAEVTRRGNQLEVNCSGPQFNAQFMLEYYEHNDNFMVCLTGDDYQNLYGYAHGMMNGNHMNQSSGTPWMNHLNNSHQSNANHSNGEFNLNQHTFGCTFLWNGQTVTFNGVKQ